MAMTTSVSLRLYLAFFFFFWVGWLAICFFNVIPSPWSPRGLCVLTNVLPSFLPSFLPVGGEKEQEQDREGKEN